MSISVLDPSHGGYLPATHLQSYDPSLSCSVSSQDSVFSDAASSASTQSSDYESDPWPTSQPQPMLSCAKVKGILNSTACTGRPCLSPPQRPSLAVPLEQRQHPRRSSSESKKTPSLVRQDQRKSCFVNDLVDSATNMVEVIWPLSTIPCTGQNGQGRGVLPLRRYIEETLRRSRTSYSTLQVALYYLVLIKAHVPKCDFTMEQPADSPSFRALQCGRRMFLAALILASKYLQDRNYSAKAWSKMSGLKVQEINTNERMFLQAVSWKLHIPDQVFKRWTDIVLRFTAAPGPPSSGCGLAIMDNKTAWRHIIPFLTPDLDTCRFSVSSDKPAINSPACLNLSVSSTPTPTRNSFQLPIISSSRENTPTPASVLPRFLEPKTELMPTAPALARMGPLPTPQMTPVSVAASTPAESACGSRRPSMGLAMAQAHTNNFCRMIVDRFPGSRSSSLAPSITSSRSSPESMISDVSRSSRSSSISSVSTTSTGAPNQACLARLATCRNAGVPLRADSPMRSMKGSAMEPITILDDADMVTSPDFSTFSIRDDSMTPVRALQPRSTPSHGACKKRGWSGGDSLHDSALQDNVRSMLRECGMDRNDVMPDESTATSPVTQCVFRKAMKSLSRSSSVSSTKAIQPPCALRKSSSSRLPICKDTGRKRTCCATKGSCEAVEEPVELFMELTPAIC